MLCDRVKNYTEWYEGMVFGTRERERECEWERGRERESASVSERERERVHEVEKIHDSLIA